MVKIKKGYVMNAREQAEYDRVNALPRKPSGKVDYYYKPQTKYPPRIYVFMHAETWCDRNRRPMGLFHAFPFLSRPMNREEIEYHHFDTRLCYHQYEDWDKLLDAEQQEADELDKEVPGSGTAFLEKLAGLRGRYHIGTVADSIPVTPAPPPETAESILLRELLAEGDKLTLRMVYDKLLAEQAGEKRAGVMILLREFHNCLMKEKSNRKLPTLQAVERKLFLSQERSRRNFVRRVFKNNKLFAIAEIAVRYPGYTEAQLLADLRRKPSRPKRKKHKPVLDLRRCQLEKLAGLLKGYRDDEKEYHTVCQRMAILAEAHRNRLPIPLTVKLQDKVLVYYFNWKIRETVVKAFVQLANSDGMTHDELGKRHSEMSGSSYSY